MKKVLSTVAALGLVAGMAATAAAADFSISGNYTVEGIYNSNGDGSGSVRPAEGTGVNENSSDSWYMHTFNINPTMKVNDKITMKAEIRLADNTIWGNQNDGDIDSSAGAKGIGGDSSDVYVHRLYMDYASPIGKIRVGRVPAGPYGAGPKFLDNDSRANRVMWWPSFLKTGPWSVLLDVVKVSENESTGNGYDDSDQYDARVYYKNDDVNAGLRYQITNGTTHDNELRQIFGFADVKFAGNYFVNMEFMNNSGDVNATVDYDAWAYMVQAGGNFDALSANIMYFFAEGDELNSTNEQQNALGTSGTGQLFEPLYILTGRTTGMLNPDVNGVNPTGYDNAGAGSNMTRSGVEAFVLSADYKVSDRLSLHGAVGYAMANEIAVAGQDDEYGTEYNIGAAYKLLDNLTYEAHFGYLDMGDYFKTTTVLNNTPQTENVYLLTHSLTMTF